LQGAVRLHGLASSPTPETQVRVACACADPPPNDTVAATAASTSPIRRNAAVFFKFKIIGCPLQVLPRSAGADRRYNRQSAAQIASTPLLCGLTPRKTGVIASKSARECRNARVLRLDGF